MKHKAIYAQALTRLTTLIAKERAKPKECTMYDRAGNPASQGGVPGMWIWHQSEKAHNQLISCTWHSQQIPRWWNGQAQSAIWCLSRHSISKRLQYRLAQCLGIQRWHAEGNIQSRHIWQEECGGAQQRSGTHVSTKRHLPLHTRTAQSFLWQEVSMWPWRIFSKRRILVGSLTRPADISRRLEEATKRCYLLERD